MVCGVARSLLGSGCDEVRCWQCNVRTLLCAYGDGGYSRAQLSDSRSSAGGPESVSVVVGVLAHNACGLVTGC
jgi:hypothetical protein